MNTLKNMEIVFENTDYAIVPYNYIKEIDIRRIEDSAIEGKYSITTDKLVIYKRVYAKDIMIKLDFTRLLKEPLKTEFEDLLSNRITIKDIAQIILNYSDETSNAFYVKYCRDEYDNNRYQENSLIDNDSTFIISICMPTAL